MGGVKGEISEKSKLGATHPLLWHNMLYPLLPRSELTFDQIHSLALVCTLVAYCEVFWLNWRYMKCITFSLLRVLN